MEDVPKANKRVFEAQLRDQFQNFVGKVYLPCFVVPNGRGGWREIEYEADILSRVNWDQVDLSYFDKLQLNPQNTGDSHFRLGLDTTIPGEQATIAADMKLDPVFITRQLLSVVPNPWVAHEYVQDVLMRLRHRYDNNHISRDLGFVIEELRKQVLKERNRLAEQAFRDMAEREELRFFLISGCPGNVIPERITVRGTRRLNDNTGAPLQRTLFDTEVEDEYNELERAVALYLDQQEWVLWWYRNLVRSGYSIQGWQAHRIYSDFVLHGQSSSRIEPAPQQIEQIYVLETKGVHLKDNEDTTYKRKVFELCNTMSEPTPWDAIAEDFSNHRVHFQVIHEDEWRAVLNAMSLDT